MNSPLVLSVAIAAAVAASPAIAQHVEFDAPWMAFDTESMLGSGGHPPLNSALVDLDGDGYLDIATANNGGSVSVLLGDGLGGFAPPVKYPVSDSTSGIAAADLDGDGDVDLAAAISGGGWTGTTVAILLNTGDGTFAPAREYFSGQGPTRITAADFDGDGDIDLAVAHDFWIAMGRSCAVLFNDGSAAFTTRRIITLPSTSYDIASGDMNGDGRIDLVVAGEYHDLSVLLNGPAGFEAPVSYRSSPVLQQDSYPAVELADMDRDGDLDVLYTSDWAGSGAFQGNTGHVGLLRNRGDGTLQPVQPIPLVPYEHAGVGLAVGDVTGDGWPDILAAQGEREFWSVVPSDGTGGFGVATPYRSGRTPFGVHVVDMDGDGDLDATVMSTDSLTVAVHYNDGGGQFRVAASEHRLTPAAWGPAFNSNASSGDLDGDGDLDVVVGYAWNWGSTGGFAVAINLGDGRFEPSATIGIPTPPEAVELADLDGDGALDLVWTEESASGRMRFRFGRGDGSFGPVQNGLSLPCGPTEIKLCDVDNDGDLDALVAGCWNEIRVAKWNAGRFSSWMFHRIVGNASALGSADFNGDGKMDLVTNTAILQTIDVSLGNGDGTFQPPSPFYTGRAVSVIVTADLNGDGAMDIATLDDVGLSMSVLLGRGTGLFRPYTSYLAGNSRNMWVNPNYNALVPGDVDADGDIDLLAPYYGSNDLALWRNRGDGTFAHQQRLGVGQRPWDVEFGDFDGDGIEDLQVLVETLGLYPALIALRGTGGDTWTDLGNALTGTYGPPALTGRSILRAGLPFVLGIDNALESSAGVFVLGATRVDASFLGGVLVPFPELVIPTTTNAQGLATFAVGWPAGVPAGLPLFTQAWVLDPVAVQGLAATNAIGATTPSLGF